jgi:hypothetical protein
VLFILKFDGVAGVEMARVDTLEIDSYAHLLVRRLDLDDGERIRDKVSGIRGSDLLDVAAEFGIKRPRDILDRTRQAIDR